MILASSSPRRLQLLKEIGITPEVISVGIDETPLAGEKGAELVKRLACAKAKACYEYLQNQHQELNATPLARQCILAADTSVWRGDDLLGKPHDADEACHMLKLLSGTTHHVSTGVCLLQLDEKTALARKTAFVETSTVRVYPLSDAQIDRYIATGEPFDKAGGYGIQGLGRLLVQSIEGEYFAIVGLPIARVMRELEALSL